MATIHDITAYRKATALRYYATYGDLSGIATRVAGGYTFRPDTTQATTPGQRHRPGAGPARAVRPGRRCPCGRRSRWGARRPHLRR